MILGSPGRTTKSTSRGMPCWLLLALLVVAGPAGARTLSVGLDQPFSRPSDAAHAAQDGDTVLIEPGEYFDCAIWTPNNLVIAGAGPGVVISDMTCQGKALFVVSGDGTTIRDLTLMRARVPDGNGAGIRLEGQGLILERVHFVNNQVGLLAGAAGAAAIRILNCSFEDGGLGGQHPLFAVRAGAVSLLRIAASTFKGVKGGQIATEASRTELIINKIETGTGEAPTVAVLASGGDLIMKDNLLSLGPNASRLATAVLAMGQGTLELRRNQMVNATGQAAALLLNWTGTDPVLQGNQVGPGDEVLSTHGLWRHWASQAYHGTKDSLRAFVGRMKRKLGL
jgi:hypothetical protein